MAGLFNSSKFSMETLTDSILNMPFIPTLVRSMGLFNNKGIATTTIGIEFDGMTVGLIPAKQRGAPATNYNTQKGVVRTLQVPHFPLNDTIKPEEIQNVRLFGSSNELAGAESVVNERLEGMAASHDATLEFLSVGAVKGVIYDSDGSTVLLDLFSEFGVTQDTIDFVLGTPTTPIKAKCMQVKRKIEAALGQGQVTIGIQAICGDAWFDAFVQHDEVKAAYALWQDKSGDNMQGDFARGDYRRGFEFCGIKFFNYTGGVGGVDFVPTNEAHFFPTGVANLFKTYFAPADFMETVNTVGLPRYARSEPVEMGRGLKIHTQSNPLCICTRPKTLVKGTTSN